MAKIASDVCKNIYITDDNPRDETPHKIRNEIQKRKMFEIKTVSI